METRLSIALGLLVLAVPATPAAAQEDCRGWARSCASVDVRADGEHLVLFAPNIAAELDKVDEPTEGSDRVTVIPAEVDSEPFATGVAGSVAYADDRYPRRHECDEEDAELAGALAEEEEKDEGCAPIAALFVLALPASIFAFTGGDAEGPTIEGPVNAPVSGPSDSPTSDDSGGQSDGGDGGAAADGAGTGDGSTAGDSGNNTGATTAGGNTGTTGGNNETGGSGGDSGNSGGTAGGGASTGGSGGGPGDNWGPFHPTGNTPAGTLGATGPNAGSIPPISQVPEPISTTLFGLGLAGYAGVQARRRRKLGLVEED